MSETNPVNQASRAGDEFQKYARAECQCEVPCDPEARPTGFRCIGEARRWWSTHGPVPPPPTPPVVLRILGKQYQIVDTPPSPLYNQYFGFHNAGKGEILVQEGLCPDQRRDTILHECLHAVDYAMCLNLEERQVHAMAAGLLALVRDNPDYFRKLFDL